MQRWSQASLMLIWRSTDPSSVDRHRRGRALRVRALQYGLGHAGTTGASEGSRSAGSWFTTGSGRDDSGGSSRWPYKLVRGDDARRGALLARPAALLPSLTRRGPFGTLSETRIERTK